MAVKTYKLRYRLGLVPLDERIEHEETFARIMAEFEATSPILHTENLAKIRQLKIKPIVLEAKGIEYFIVDERWKYFFVEQPLNENQAKWYQDGIAALKEAEDHKFRFVTAVVPDSIQVTLEGARVFEKAGIHIFNSPL